MSLRVTVLCGFLGSGKTTLARRLVDSRHCDDRIALIVNEFGEVPVDAAILRGRHVEVIELNSGCICCQLRGTLVLALEELRDQGVDRVLVEASGLARPGELKAVLANPTAKLRFDCGPWVSVVDAAKFNKLRAVLGEFYLGQLADADVIILNKIDLAAAQELDAVQREMKRINPQALVAFADHGDVDPSIVLGRSVSSASLPRDGSHGLRQSKDPVDRPVRMLAQRDRSDAAAPAFQTFAVDAAGPRDEARVRAFFASLPDGVWRAKGFIDLDGAPALVQYAFGQLEITAAPGRPKPQLVFIGANIEQAAIMRAFARTLAP